MYIYIFIFLMISCNRDNKIIHEVKQSIIVHLKVSRRYQKSYKNLQNFLQRYLEDLDEN